MVKLSVLLYGLQALILVLAAPLVSGIVKIVKARLQNRRGPGILQVYRDIYKLLRKDSVISPSTSWLFAVTPFLYFAAAVAASAVTPVLGAGADFFAVLYIFAFGRFFLALASLDAGSAFGGMGGSREMFISVLVEPALLLALLTVAFTSGGTSLAGMAVSMQDAGYTLSRVFAMLAFLIVLIAETGRIPVDNPDTHLELTMVHEGMVLEYSGRFLGLIVWAASVKQLIFYMLFALLFLPAAFFGAWSIPVLILGVCAAVAAIESFTNKMRLFRVPGLLSLSALLSLLALVAQ